MPAYIPKKKNLFVFKYCPEEFFVEDSYIILRSDNFLKKIDLSEIKNIFSIFTFPVWITHHLKIRGINIFYINTDGELERVYTDKKRQPKICTYSLYEAYCILRHKSILIDSLFKESGALSFFEMAGKHKINPEKINSQLNLMIKISFIDKVVLNYQIPSKQADGVVSILLNLTDNIVPLAFLHEFEDINTDMGILNKKFPSTVRDITELSVVRFKRKLLHLFEAGFFEKEDFDKEYIPDTVFRFLKILSNYFFYANRFKRRKEILYIKNSLKRGMLHEVFNCL
ncbi:hypothetical protein [Persephonella sp.]